MQITDSDIAKYRKMFATKQKYKCPICGGNLANTVTALDHDHNNGMLRSTLCMACNRAEGKVKAGAHYMQKAEHLSKTNYIGWLKNLVDYLEFHFNNPSGIIHPTFDVEKGKQKPKKRRRKYAKRK